MFKVKIAQENNFQIAIVITDHNPAIGTSFAEDHQNDKIHKIFHKIDIADQIVRIVSIETITLDETQVEVTN